MTYCYIQFIQCMAIQALLVLSFLSNYNNFKYVWLLSFCSRMYCLDIKCLTHTFIPPFPPLPWPSLSLSATLSPSLYFRSTRTYVQLNPHVHAICFYAAKLTAVLGKSTLAEEMWTQQCSHSLQGLTALKSSLKHNIHTTSKRLCARCYIYGDIEKRTMRVQAYQAG